MANKEQSIARGKKWYGRGAETDDWCNKQSSIMADVENYLDSIKKPEVKNISKKDDR